MDVPLFMPRTLKSNGWLGAGALLGADVCVIFDYRVLLTGFTAQCWVKERSCAVVCDKRDRVVLEYGMHESAD